LLGVVGSALAPLAPPSAPSPFSSRPTSASDVKALDLSASQADCGSSGSGYWSPDGQRIAVLSCFPDATRPDLAIYNANTGAQVGAYNMSKPILDTLAKINESQLSSTLTFDGLSWAPSQHMLAGLWHAFDGSKGSKPALATRWDVLALLITGGAQSGHVSVAISGKTTASTAPIGLSPAPVGHTEAQEWDIGNHGVVTIDLTNAQTYAWDSSDHVIVTYPYPGSGGLTPEPAEGQAFSVWMTGTIDLANASSCSGSSVTPTPVAPTPNVTLLTLTVIQWSPDSRYLLSFATQARVPNAPGLNQDQASLVAPTCLTATQASAIPIIAAHDQGMRAALGLLGGRGNVDQVTLQWSVDGRRLLAIPSTIGSAPTTAIIYDATTGVVLAQLSAGSSDIPSAEGSDASGAFTGGAWSPNGQRLLLGANTRQSFNILIYSGRALG
jgi:hypothetical protein